MFHKFIFDSSEENEDDYDMNFIDPSYNENKPVKNDSINEPKSHYDHSSNRKFDYGYKNQKCHNHNYSNPKYGYKQEQNYKRNRGAPLSPQDQYRKKIAEENHKIVLKHPELIDFDGVKTIGIYHHFNIPDNISRKCPIRVFDCSTIEAAIQCHDAHPQNKICILNFANSVRPGGGYLNGRNAQEECLCRQTLLYPTIQKSYMYYENKQKGSKPEASDIMIYSPNVLVIRNDDYKMIHPFRVDIISSAAVDNRGGNIYNIEEIMMNRIRKIIKIAAEEKVEVLILGAFGCGVFKNDPKITAEIFYHVLVEENFKKYFRLVLFPIYKSQYLYNIFSSILESKKHEEYDNIQKEETSEEEEKINDELNDNDNEKEEDKREYDEEEKNDNDEKEYNESEREYDEKEPEYSEEKNEYEEEKNDEDEREYD